MNRNGGCSMKIREFTLGDYVEVANVWEQAGITVSASDSLKGIVHKVGRDSELFLVAEENEKIVGSVMGSYDGRRGWINHLAVHPDYQGKRVGKLIMEELEQRLKRIGCKKINLLIEYDNSKVIGFYENLGYNTDELVFMEKWIK